MIHEPDRKVIDGYFDRRTLARAQSYVSAGAVLSADWDPGGDRVTGSVRGSGAHPYEVTVDIERAGDGRLVSVDGECSCPVSYDCKHAAALLLSALRSADAGAAHPKKAGARRVAPPGGTAEPGAGQTAHGGTPWDSLLGALASPSAGGAGDASEHPPSVALQFELVAGTTHTAPRIKLRPVVPGTTGNWVRSGISWRTVDYMGCGWGRLRCSEAQIRVLKELRAISSSSISSTRYSAYTPAGQEVWLDAIGSRRIWDLFAEAEDAGVPLVGTGRRAARVTVGRFDAELSLDASAPPDEPSGGFTLSPRLAVQGVEVPLRRTGWQLIATPPHGIAWWDPATAEDTPALSFARLPELLTAPWPALLGGAKPVVPHEDRERFFDVVYPRLRRRLRVESTDGTVDIPEVPDDALILTLCHGDDHRLELSWWTGVPGATRREKLGDPRRAGYDGPIARAIGAAHRLALPHSTGRLLAPFGDRLEREASLQGMDTVRFLTDVLPDLEAIPGLSVEHTGEHPDYREAPNAPSVTLSGTPHEGHDWFDLAVDVRVGGEEVPFVDLFTALATGQSHMLLPSGTYFSLEDEALRELAQLIDEARALHAGDDDHVRVTRYQASLWGDLARLGVLTAQAAEWERSVRALATAADRTEHPVPTGLDARLRPYQHVGFDWLVFLYELGLGGILADDMGLGKTLQVLALVCHVGEHRLSDAPFLVVAPTSVVGNWANECRKFAPGLGVETVTATTSRRGRTLFDVAATADVVVTSYALFRLEYDDYEKLEWAGLVLDEAQFAKNMSSHAYQRAKTLPVRFKLAMTGTPMENHLMELWALLSITSPGLLGSAERFSELFRQPIERHADEDRLTLLRRRIQPLLLRRSKEQVAGDLPDKQEQVMELELNPRHRKLYQTYLQRERQKVLGLLDDLQRNRFEILKSLTVLRQASLSAALVDPTRHKVPSTKLDALMEMLEEVVADGHRVLVFSQFTRFLTMARERVRAAGIAHCYLDGRTRRRTHVLSEFRSGSAPVFLISLKAGGFGLNLTEADYCILLDPWWNPATEAQAIDRVHRIGQTKNVMVYRLVAKDTIEEKVMALKAKKAALFSSVIDSGAFQSGALTTADIRGLLD
ncbi:MAG: SNF2-related protein [Acidimicrobiales bacterium]